MLDTKAALCPNRDRMIPLFLMTPMTIEPMPRASMAKKSPNQETPRRSVGIPAILPTQPMAIPMIKRNALRPFSTTARMDSAAATPGGQAPSAGYISESKVL